MKILIDIPWEWNKHIVLIPNKSVLIPYVRQFPPFFISRDVALIKKSFFCIVVHLVCQVSVCLSIPAIITQTPLFVRCSYIYSNTITWPCSSPMVSIKCISNQHRYSVRKTQPNCAIPPEKVFTAFYHLELFKKKWLAHRI